MALSVAPRSSRANRIPMRRHRQTQQAPGSPAPGVFPRTIDLAARRYARHFARYLFAYQYAHGARTVDATCGTGYGAGYLGRTAEYLLALDIDEQRIEWARLYHNVPNTQYAVHDLHCPIPTEDQFALVTSFETLEHVDDPSLCLKNLADALSSHGTALISVPNGTKELADGNNKPYHQTHFSALDFEALLRGQFKDICPYSQVYTRNVLHYLSKWIRGYKRLAQNYRFVPGWLENAKTWIAVCRKPKR